MNRDIHDRLYRIACEISFINRLIIPSTLAVFLGRIALAALKITLKKIIFSKKSEDFTIAFLLFGGKI